MAEQLVICQWYELQHAISPVICPEIKVHVMDEILPFHSVKGKVLRGQETGIPYADTAIDVAEKMGVRTYVLCHFHYESWIGH